MCQHFAGSLLPYRVISYVPSKNSFTYCGKLLDMRVATLAEAEKMLALRILEFETREPGVQRIICDTDRRSF